MSPAILKHQRNPHTHKILLRAPPFCLAYCALPCLFYSTCLAVLCCFIFPHEALHTLSQLSENFTSGTGTLILESNYFEPLRFNSQSQKSPEDKAKVGPCQKKFLWPVFSFLYREKLFIIIADFFHFLLFL